MREVSGFSVQCDRFMKFKQSVRWEQSKLIFSMQMHMSRCPIEIYENK